MRCTIIADVVIYSLVVHKSDGTAVPIDDTLTGGVVFESTWNRQKHVYGLAGSKAQTEGANIYFHMTGFLLHFGSHSLLSPQAPPSPLCAKCTALVLAVQEHRISYW